MTRRWLVVAVLLVAFAGSATTLIAMDVPALTRASDLVVRGTVMRVESRWTQDKSRIMTDSELVVSQVLKGNLTSNTVVVMQPGGVVGDVGQLVHGVAKFNVGDEVVVFLEKRGDRAFVVGLAQGRFLVDRSGDRPMVRGGEEELFLVDAKTHQPVASPNKPMTLEALTALIRQSLGPAQTVPPLAPGKVLVP